MLNFIEIDKEHEKSQNIGYCDTVWVCEMQHTPAPGVLIKGRFGLKFHTICRKKKVKKQKEKQEKKKKQHSIVQNFDEITKK